MKQDCSSTGYGTISANYGFDLGTWKRDIATASPEARAWFNLGLNWTYAYNHEEAISCYREALRHDSDCAMAWWGIAYAGGSFYNRPWIRYTEREIAETLPFCHDAVREARRALERANNNRPDERALVEAISIRYQSRSETSHQALNRWHREFTDEMRTVYVAHRTDADIVALFAEAAITCTPRQLWNLKTGRPNPDALTEEAISVLETSIEQIEESGICHPGILHMYIHAMEMSPFPERALRAADMLRGLVPDGGHIEHVAAHIYVLCGDYAQATEQSRRAVHVDDKYLDIAGPCNFYTTARCHDLHLYMYTAMFLGHYVTAIGAANRICATATPELVASSYPFMASILDGYSAMRTHVYVRFGKWRELIQDQLPGRPEQTPIRVAMYYYGKGIACSALGDIKKAESARFQFDRHLETIPQDAIFLSNSVRDILLVGKAMLEGELEYRKRNYDLAFDALRLAVERDDNLNFTEPWAWMHPPRHALGALLLQQGRLEEAESVYRADLGYTDDISRCSQHPDNVWALHGLLECVKENGDSNEARLLEQKLRTAQARTDVSIASSCYCRIQ